VQRKLVLLYVRPVAGMSVACDKGTMRRVANAPQQWRRCMREDVAVERLHKRVCQPSELGYGATNFIAGTSLQCSEFIAPLTYATGADGSLRQ
jgi:hypothetical protein